uniref:Uncharacterized protein n=2 Tax=Bursaphelenchus xylophilus TaxID=6326 RepID=A0A1I7SQK5_BURXY
MSGELGGSGFQTPINKVQNDVLLDESERLTPQVPENGQNLFQMELNFEEKIEVQVEQYQNIELPDESQIQNEDVSLKAEVPSAPSPNENSIQHSNPEPAFAAPMPPKNDFGGSGRIAPRVANSAPLINSTNVPHYMYPTFSAVRRIEETQKQLAMRSANRVEVPKRIERKFSNSHQ